jgi:protein SCO1/2
MVLARPLAGKAKGCKALRQIVASQATLSTVIRFALAAVGLMACLAGACAAFQDSGRAATLADAPHIPRVSLFRYPWVWTDEEGKPAKFAEWRGQPLVVTTMFTTCRATCPRTLKKMRSLYDEFQSKGHAAQFLMVTLDPVTDTPERLREFKKSEGLPDSWHLLSGTIPQTEDLTGILDIHVMSTDAHLIHDARIVLFDADGIPTRSFSGFSLDDETPIL